MRVIRWRNASTGVESLTITSTGVYFPVGNVDSGFKLKLSMASAGQTASVDTVRNANGTRTGYGAMNVSGTTETKLGAVVSLATGIIVNAISGTLNAILDNETAITSWPDSLGRFPAVEDATAYVHGSTPPVSLIAVCSGNQVRWGGAAVGWVQYVSPGSLGIFLNYASLPSTANDGDIAYIPQIVGSEYIRMRYKLASNRWSVEVGQTIAVAVDPFSVVAGSAGSYDKTFCTIPAEMWGAGEEWEFTQPTESAPTLAGIVSSRMLFGAIAGTVFTVYQNGRNAASEAFIRYGNTVKRTRLIHQTSIDGGISTIAPNLAADLVYTHRITLASAGDSCYIRYSRITRIG